MVTSYPEKTELHRERVSQLANHDKTQNAGARGLSQARASQPRHRHGDMQALVNPLLTEGGGSPGPWAAASTHRMLGVHSLHV